MRIAGIIQGLTRVHLFIMETTILIAQILGVYFLVSGVFVVTHKKTFGLFMKDFFKNRVLLYVVGAFLVVGGATIIYTSPEPMDWLGWFVKIMGWAILIKGALYVLSPETLHRMVKPWTRSTLMLMGLAVAAVGAYLVFFL